MKTLKWVFNWVGEMCLCVAKIEDQKDTLYVNFFFCFCPILAEEEEKIEKIR